MKLKPVPVIMYHSIGVINEKWLWKHLTCPWEIFENHLKWLKIMRFHSISLKQLYDYKRYKALLPANPVVLTFDDGYLDNWVFAYPLLKKYGFKGTIFINPEFIDPRKVIRKNLEDVWFKHEPIEKLETKGFLSWEELKIIDRSGILDIQSHSMSHTWYFCSDEIIDFHWPGSKDYPWLSWNEYPKKKYLYLNENQEKFVPYGAPIYRYGRSLGIKRYFEDKNLTTHLVNYVKNQGKDFFNINNSKTKLFKEAKLYKSKNKLNGRYETNKEQKLRFEYELIESKKILEKRLRKKINFLCWPGGAKTDLSIKISQEAGYLASTFSVDKEGGKNIPGEDCSKIYRFGSPIIKFRGEIYYLGGMALIVSVFSFRWHFLGDKIFKVVKLFKFLTIIINIKIDGKFLKR
ncbi:MAG: polysaccharide deacetylase family protein [Promethearchaeota archaeon]